MSSAGRSTAWAAVVVNHNGGPLLEQCVRSLVDGGAGEIVVVDNASSDGSVEALEAAELPVVVLRSGENRGYAAAANLGIAATTSPVVAVVNPDAELQPESAPAVLERFTDAAVAAVGPRILNPDGTTYPSARVLPAPLDAVGHGLLLFVRPRNRFTRRYRQLDADPDQPREVDWVSGAAIWLRRSALDRVGGWDEGYFMYVEDVDLCWRLREAGWRVVYEPGGTVVHVQGTATSRRPYRMLVEHHRSMLRFAAKRWRGPRRILLVPAAAFLVVRAAVAAAHHALGGRSGTPVGGE